jgi:hypothetical protein
MAKDKATAEYSKPASQVDLEERLAKGHESSLVLSTYGEKDPEPDPNARQFALEDNDLSDYIATDPIYQNYASDHLKPGRAEEGAEAEVEKFVHGETEVYTEGTPIPEVEAPVQKVIVVGMEVPEDEDDDEVQSDDLPGQEDPTQTDGDKTQEEATGQSASNTNAPDEKPTPPPAVTPGGDASKTK